MSRCYVCDHSIVATCQRCDSELTICDTRGADTLRDEGTEVRVVPCDCKPDTSEHMGAIK